MKWEKLKTDGFRISRTAIPGGWLALVQLFGSSPSITFYPDPQHEWGGASVALQ
jgi:hypothetical protein